MKHGHMEISVKCGGMSLEYCVCGMKTVTGGITDRQKMGWNGGDQVAEQKKRRHYWKEYASKEAFVAHYDEVKSMPEQVIIDLFMVGRLRKLVQGAVKKALENLDYDQCEMEKVLDECDNCMKFSDYYDLVEEDVGETVEESEESGDKS